MKRHYSIGETFIRFFSVMKYRKIMYLKYILPVTIKGLNVIIHVIFLQKLTFFLENSDKEGFLNMLFIYMGVIIVYEILYFSTRRWGWVETIPHTRVDIFNLYVGKYIRMDNTAIEKLGTGKLIGIIQTGAIRWAESIANVMERGTEMFIAILFSCYLLSQYNSSYIIYFILFLSFSLWTSIIINKHQFSYRSERYDLRNALWGRLTKIIMSKNEILQTNRFRSEVKEMEQISKKLAIINQDMGVGRTGQKRIMPFFMSCILVGIFFIYGTQVLEGTMSMSQLVGMTGAIIVIQSILVNFLNFYSDLSKDFIEVQKLWNFFDTTPEIQGYNSGKRYIHKKGDISIQDISFEYEKNQKVFEGFNLDIEGGKITAFVGNSGSGKSTLIKMIAGYIHADAGKILIDQQEISQISLKSYYKNTGYLTQEPSVFDGTIIDNLIYALNKKPTKKELDTIIKLSKCEFIYDLANGLKTEIGEKGIRLSGGQRQRLAIAKIFLKDPKIIILDEPTSALDSFSEEQITKAMHNLFQGRTVIIIAHRLQTVKNADKIIVLENGKIAEKGNHNSLIRKKGIYAKMLKLQSGF